MIVLDSLIIAIVVIGFFILIQKVLRFRFIEKRWRKACLHVGLTMETNLEKDIKEFPPVIKVSSKWFVVEGRGIVPERIETVKFELSSASGLFLSNARYCDESGHSSASQVKIDYSRRDLPFNVSYAKSPKTENVLTFGLKVGGWLQKEIPDVVHVGIAGASGNGKSVMLRSLITQIIQSDPNNVILGVDFKGGAELNFFGLHRNFIATTDHHQAAPALELIYWQMKKRAKFVAQSNVDNIYESDHYVPSIFVIIDEAQNFWEPEPDTPKDVSEKAAWHLQALAKQSRFVGIHLIVATQRPDSKAISTAVRSMLGTRIIFKVDQKEDSIMWIGNAAATKIRTGDNGLGKGRFLLEENGSLIEAQAPYISKEHAISIIQNLPAPIPSKLVDSLHQAVNQ